MKKFIPLLLTPLLLVGCGGGSTPTPQTVNVTGTWNGGLETTTGGGLGAVEVTLTQSAAPATDFKGTMSSPLSGSTHPLVGDVAQGTLKTDTSIAPADSPAAFACQGTFTNNSYLGTCEFLVKNDTKFVLRLGRK